MQGAEIWIPKLPSARVVDLARAIAPDAMFEVVGMRGAEKLHEAMISPIESGWCWDCGDRFVLLPKTGAWYSPAPPVGARRVPVGFSYSSDQDPANVSFSHEMTPCVSASLA